MKIVLKKILVYIMIFLMLFQTTNVYAFTKEESVYAKLNETGEIDSVSVSEHLYDYNDKIINDKTILQDIKNINENQKFTLNDNNLVWETNGNDVYYQGLYKKDLPISISVKYYLNDEEKNIDDILGKSGNVRIVLTYNNNQYKNMNVNGSLEKMYVPYAIVTTSILNNKDNKNIKVTNGKIIDNGLTSIVMAISSPGLYESLKLEELKDINKVEISFDTDSFELNSIYSVATTNLFEDNNLEIFGKINDLYNNIDLLQSNMDTIVDGANKLNDGTSQMDAGITELNSKFQEVNSKYQYYRNQDTDILKEKIMSIVEDNIDNIVPLLEEEIASETSKIIKDNKDELEQATIYYAKENTKTVIDEELKKIINQLDINSLIDKVINDELYSILENDSDILELTNTLKENINNEIKNIIEEEFNNSMTQSTDEKYISDIAEKYGVTYEQAKGIVGEVQTDTLNQIKNNTDITEKIISSLNNTDLINNYVNEISNRLNDKDINISDDLKKQILDALYKDLEDENIYINLDVKEYISNVVDKIVDNTVSDLSNRYTEEYTNQVVKNIVEKEFSKENVDSKLNEELTIYRKDINNKIMVLDDVMNKISYSLNMLNDGSKQISNGMNQLSLGLDKYNREGINKINNLVNGDVKNIQERFNALMELSDENKTIDSIPLGSIGNSKMIFMIDSKSKVVKKKKEVKKEKDNSSFWAKVKGLFN